VLERLRSLILGGRKNIFDPRIHHQLALIAFFAWVGLGSDGLSSSSYGPEEAFLTLGTHTHLALYLTVATVLTVFLISASYTQIIELFPTGGGGYLVATKLLGTTAGVVSGGALVVDYVLTIAISVASGVDALFSFLPLGLAPFKVPCEILMVGGLTALNLRGVKESVSVLMPIFVAFVISHFALITFGVFTHLGQFGPMIAGTVNDTRVAAGELGKLGVIALFLKAFSLGGGTFTGIEAVSNSTAILREPRVETGKRTMAYMAGSLSFTAGGILLCYLLNGVAAEPGRTLNASLWSLLTHGWTVFGIPVGLGIVVFTLIAEGALLFVAAQTGFVAGPATLAAMAVDQWVPKRFAHLSERLVTQNGIITMGLAAIALIVYSAGAVKLLIVMYSINVFLTFTLSQLGMVRHWWAVRRTEAHWRRRFLLASLGTLVTAGILLVTSVIKFSQGGWVTLAVTGAFILLCWVVRGHYQRVRGVLKSLDDVLSDLPMPERESAPELAPEGPTAVVLVESYAGLGIHTLLTVQRMFPRHFKNIVFVSVGLVDSGQFKGTESVRALVFAGQLVFQRETVFTRTLHHETAFSIQRRLQFAGIQVIILPIRVWQNQRTA